ncbi:MAG: anthranilate synthase component I, partial [bacterium]
MIPDLKQYEQLANDYNLIPVYGETLADSETPVSVLGRFVDCRNVFLLESMEGGETWGRYSFIGVDPELFLEADHSAGRTGSLGKLRTVYDGVKVAPVADLPRFCGGVVGFIGYDGI